MTIFGVDVSEWQNGLSLVEAARESDLDFAIIRTTDGIHRDRVYQSHLADAEAAGLITSAYHYLRNPREGSSIAAQVQASLEVMGNQQRPMWIDVETPAGIHVDHIRECKRLFEQAGVRVIGCYSYVPYWEHKISPNEPDSHEFGAFWVAAYGTNTPGPPKNIYPGNSHRQWNYPLGNQQPALWQFSSEARFGSWRGGNSGVDINAFRGTREQLHALFYGTTSPMEESEPMRTDIDSLILDQLAGPGRDAHGHTFAGWPQLGGRTVVDALAAIGEALEVQGFSAKP
ncbi:glycoside hydrolase family 25 protein [Corynebacterium freiburgense]|uniref:glycoside hydrolase family 25 protein n=1 Tax=Corynebacterium freiburgense TaxID=556548 RepID=UPI00042348B8|nr:GH25 family lysozyme [Corynebacterium freiburgense]WJZ03468.1 Lysozyme M1 precursor [Corynebacterium freiburgense]WJZ03580.1 Lysozyme M1 precursor [Corynebacterium freiburgense]WJZ03997.1 Lysozyme M1 precursor [Corynebacterium freiburgense]